MADCGRNLIAEVYVQFAMERNSQQLECNTLADFRTVNIHFVKAKLLALTLKDCSSVLEKLDIGMDYNLEFGCCHNQRLPPMEVVGRQKNIEHNPGEIVLASEIASTGIVVVFAEATAPFAGVAVEPMVQHNC